MISLDLPQEQNQQLSEAPAMAPTDGNNCGIVSDAFLKWATLALFAYFGMRLLFFATSISSFVPPDEVTHMGVSRIFSSVFLLPDNTPESYEFGLVTTIPWLYYWIMGKLLHLNIFGLSDLVFLRLLNIPLAFGTVWYALRLHRLLTADRLSRLLLLVAMTNTAMFSLLSASVSYDNLTNLLAAMSIYYLFAFFKARSGNLLAASILCQLAGSLTKITILPLVLVLNILLLVHEFRNLRSLPSALKCYFQTSGLRNLVLALLVLVALGLNLQLYAGDYLRYGTLTPPMSVVLSPEAAMNYRLDERGMIFNRYKEGKISYMDALILTGEIKHPGDKADTFYLLMNYEKMKRNPQLWMSPFEYAKFWYETMLATVFGIKGHLGMFKSPPWMVPIHVLMALAALGFIVRWRPRDAGWRAPSLAAIAAFYAGFLMYEINYDSYLNYGEPSLTVYGRYLFPILVPVYVLLCHYLLQIFRTGYVRGTLALATSLLFISYDFPWFLMHATPEWYTWLPR
jgi:hypothetical protein